MHSKLVAWKVVAMAVLVLAPCGCKRSSSVREPPITGKSSDPPVAMQPRWGPDKRYIYQVETQTSSQVPRRNTGKMIRAETTLGQELAFKVTNAAPDGSRVLQMEVLAVQMETSRDDGVTMSFDSENKAIFVEDSPLTERLQKLVGVRLAFHLSPENKITRVDGTKEMSDRLSSGGNNAVRGVAGGVMGRLFSAQFFRDLVEMGMLPTSPVRIHDSWTVSRQVNAGLWGTSAQMDLTYRFRGWQQHDGTNCARLDFSGTFKPAPIPPPPNSGTNRPPARRTAQANSPNVEEGTVIGQCWFDPELSLAVDTVYDQSITTKSTSVRRQRVQPGTNRQPADVTAPFTNSPPATNAPQQTVTTTTTTQQHTRIRLVEVEVK